KKGADCNKTCEKGGEHNRELRSRNNMIKIICPVIAPKRSGGTMNLMTGLTGLSQARQSAVIAFAIAEAIRPMEMATPGIASRWQDRRRRVIGSAPGTDAVHKNANHNRNWRAPTRLNPTIGLAEYWRYVQRSSVVYCFL